MSRIVHSIGLFHTQGTDDHSHCAYTQKTRRLVTMLAAHGFKVVHYHVGDFVPIYGPYCKADIDQNITLVQLYDANKLMALRELAKDELEVYGTFEGDLANVGTVLFREFDSALTKAIADYPSNKNEDIFLHHFGWPHQHLGAKYPKAIHIEPGIGYPDTFAPYRIFESKAWADHVLGKNNKMPQYGDFVIPNHFDETYWTYDPKVQKEGVVYMGRIYDMKGCQIVAMLSDRFDVPFYLAGQGNSQYIDNMLKKHPNITYLGSLKGYERVELLQKTKVMILPTQYFEPFGGAIIEGAMCGAYPVASDFGVFPENLKDIGITCRTFKDYIDALDYGLSCDDKIHGYIAEKSARKYGMTKIGIEYFHILNKISDMHMYDWIGFKL